jgi:diguanylate cyclase (GGDEF)-like protein
MQLLGMTHAEVSGLLAEQWKLPPVLSVPMAYHHRPGEVADPAVTHMAELVHLAGRCADVFVEERASEPIAAVRRFCQERYKISEQECDQLLDEICTRTREVAPLFEISIASSTTYEGILKKANEALVEMTLRTQQQAATLQQQNQQLQHQATTDGLTGLANRAAFDEFLAAQFSSAQESGKPLSMLLIDVDKFKSVNDTHGHPAGDTVLKAIAKILRSAGRAQDLAARYGGEELVLVLPSTPRMTAAAVAESIRRAISAKPIETEEVALPITVSIGVACFEPGLPFTQPAHLIKAADLSVYAAKHAGRNNVKVFTLKSTAAA